MPHSGYNTHTPEKAIVQLLRTPLAEKLLESHVLYHFQCMHLAAIIILYNTLVKDYFMEENVTLLHQHADISKHCCDYLMHALRCL